MANPESISGTGLGTFLKNNDVTSMTVKGSTTKEVSVLDENGEVNSDEIILALGQLLYVEKADISFDLPYGDEEETTVNYTFNINKQ